MSLQQTIGKTWKRDGLLGVAARTLVYSLRRVSWVSDSWSTKLDEAVTKRGILNEAGPFLKRNEAFRDKHAGKRCFIIGNGPSLKKQDLTPLADEITFATNYFHLHPIVGPNWQPDYYCLTDPAYFDGSEPLSSFHEVARQIRNAPFFVPHSAREFLERTSALPADRTFYVAMSGSVRNMRLEKPDLTKINPGVQTVVQLAIMAAMYMGCSTIYLLGLDSNWLSHGGQQTSFYSAEDEKSQPDGTINNWSYKDLMAAVTTIWTIYEALQKLAQISNVRIVNATRGGFLDVFERAIYEEVIEDKLVTTV